MKWNRIWMEQVMNCKMNWRRQQHAPNRISGKPSVKLNKRSNVRLKCTNACNVSSFFLLPFFLTARRILGNSDSIRFVLRWLKFEHVTELKVNYEPEITGSFGPGRSNVLHVANERTGVNGIEGKGKEKKKNEKVMLEKKTRSNRSARDGPTWMVHDKRLHPWKEKAKWLNVTRLLFWPVNSNLRTFSQKKNCLKSARKRCVRWLVEQLINYQVGLYINTNTKDDRR